MLRRRAARLRSEVGTLQLHLQLERSLRRLQEERSMQRGSSVKSTEGKSCPASPSPAVRRSCRLVVLGSAQTGKTSVVRRFLDNKFTDRYIPTIEEFHRKIYKIRADVYQLDIIDTSGYDPFPAARRLSYLSGDLFLLVCSVDVAASADEALRIAAEIAECKQRRFGPDVHMPTVIAVNKADVGAEQRRMDVDAVRERAAQLRDCSVVVCSAKTAAAVDQVFSQLFALAKLPKQMSPQLHRALHADRSADDACLGRHDLAAQPSPLRRLRTQFTLVRQHTEPKVITFHESSSRRPSLRTDLLLAKVTKEAPANADGASAQEDRHRCLIS